MSNFNQNDKPSFQRKLDYSKPLPSMPPKQHQNQIASNKCNYKKKNHMKQNESYFLPQMPSKKQRSRDPKYTGSGRRKNAIIQRRDSTLKLSTSSICNTHDNICCLSPQSSYGEEEPSARDLKEAKSCDKVFNAVDGIRSSQIEGHFDFPREIEYDTSSSKQDVLGPEGTPVDEKWKGLLSLTNIIKEHLRFMNTRGIVVDDIITQIEQNDEVQADRLRTAKHKAVEEERHILEGIMSNVVSLSDFLRNIVLMENLFNKTYQKLQNEQKNARSEYNLRFRKYEDNLNEHCIINKGVDSFENLMYSALSLHIGDFQECLSGVVVKCDERNIKITYNSGANIKRIERAFYKAFYMYHSGNDCGYEHVTDTLRATLVFDTFEDLYDTFGIIEGMDNIDILRIKDRFQKDKVPFGYRDILINFYCPNSKIICELQLQHNAFYKYKNRAHDIYKKARIFEHNGCNLAYDYAEKFVRPKFGDKDISNYQYIDNRYDEIQKVRKRNKLFRKGKELLIQWGLKQYITVLIDEGDWNDPTDWVDLKENDLKNDFGFKDYHCRKFIRKYKKWANML